MANDAVYAGMELHRELTAYLHKLQTLLPRFPGEFGDLCSVLDGECGAVTRSGKLPGGSLVSTKTVMLHLRRLHARAPTRWRTGSGHRCDNVESFVQVLDALADRLRQQISGNGSTSHEPLLLLFYRGVHEFCESMKGDNPSPFHRQQFLDRLDLIAPARPMDEEEEEDEVESTAPPVVPPPPPLRRKQPKIIRDKDDSISSWIPELEQAPAPPRGRSRNKAVGAGPPPGRSDRMATQPLGRLTPDDDEGEDPSLEMTLHDDRIEQHVATDVARERGDAPVPRGRVSGLRAETPGPDSGGRTRSKVTGQQMIGMMLGKYKLDALVGTGASSWVFRAMHPKLNFPVAIKVLATPADLAAQARIDDFFHEARISMQMNHPHSVRTFDLEEHEGLHFIVMEFVEGPTAKDMLDKDGPFTERQVLDLALGICNVLESAYEQRIIHRDIKPQNIIYTPAGILKLSDLGLAKVASFSGTSEGVPIVGTPLYIAPEAIQDPGRVDFRADIYSIGATMYHLVTGRTPFDGDTIHDLFQAHLSHFLPDPRTRREDLSPGTAGLIMHMMEKRPDKRHPSYSALHREIEALLSITSNRRGGGSGIFRRLKSMIGG